jgi:putative transposase
LIDTWHKEITSCVHCDSEDISSIGNTDLGYDRFRCYTCKRTFNERTVTPFNRLEYPTDIALQVVRWSLTYKISLRDLSQMFFERGILFTHQTVSDWLEKYTPLITKELRRRRSGNIGESWALTRPTFVLKARTAIFTEQLTVKEI